LSETPGSCGGKELKKGRYRKLKRVIRTLGIKVSEFMDFSDHGMNSTKVAAFVTPAGNREFHGHSWPFQHPSGESITHDRKYWASLFRENFGPMPSEMKAD
jgi:hypothetical protein